MGHRAWHCGSTCSSSDRSFWGVDAVTTDRLGATSSLFCAGSWAGFDDRVHVLHQFQLLPPKILMLDEFLPGLVFFLSDTLLLRFQPGETMQGQGKKTIQHSIQYADI